MGNDAHGKQAILQHTNYTWQCLYEIQMQSKVISFYSSVHGI